MVHSVMLPARPGIKTVNRPEVSPVRFTYSSATPSSIFRAYSPRQRKGTRPGHRQTFDAACGLSRLSDALRQPATQTSPRNTRYAPVVGDLPFARAVGGPRSSRTPAAVSGLCTGKSPNSIKEISQSRVSPSQALVRAALARPGAEGQRSAALILPRRGIERRRWG